MSLFESFFNDSSPKSSSQTLEKWFEKTHLTFRSVIEIFVWEHEVWAKPKIVGKTDETFDEYFRTTFQWLVAQIEYSNP